MLMTTRSWRWLSTRIAGLLDKPPTYAASGAAVYSTRLARHFYQQAAFEEAQRAAKSN